MQCLLHLVDDVDEWHLSAIIKSVSILCGVEHFVVMPHKVNALGDNGCPNLPNHFVQTDWSHVFQVGASSDLRGKSDHLIFHPRWSRLLQPEVLHMLVHFILGAARPILYHVSGQARRSWCGAVLDALKSFLEVSKSDFSVRRLLDLLVHFLRRLRFA